MSATFLGVLIRLSLCSIAAASLAADKLHDPVCRVLLDAMSKSARGPVHAYSTIGNLSEGTVPEEIETITIGDVAYTKIRGEWKVGKSRHLVDEFIEQMTLAPDPLHCEQERDAPFEGDAAAVYKIRLGEGDRIVEGRFWISKTRGLMIHATLTITINRRVTHASVRYDYTNVQAPTGTLDGLKH
jgi:hypothetical protein